MMENQTEEYSLPNFSMFYRRIAPSYSEAVFHYPPEYHIDKLSSYINEFYLANGIKELLKEHAFDLSLLLNKVTNDSRGMVYRIACCQHNTHCRNEILWFKNRDTTT
jgi:hypothetical protein